MTESPEELAAVEQLLTERDAVHGWLVRVDQAGAGAPESVRARVRQDYQRRLDEITAGLRAHLDAVTSRLAEDRREHDALVARATAAREALAEAELRHAVGEYDDARFEAERAKYAGEIESLDVSATAIAARIDHLEEVQALAHREPREQTATADVPDGDVAVVATVIEETEVVAIDDLSPDAESESALAIFDDGESAETPAAPELGPLTFRPSGGATEPGIRRRGTPVPAAFEQAPPLGIPGADQPPRFVRPGERMRPARPPAATVPPVEEPAADRGELLDEEIVATGPAPEAPEVPVGRTLRCGECGAMNRPLEWYCEKCGAELAAV